MEEYKEDFKDVLQLLQNDYGDLGVGIELLEEELYSDELSVEKVKTLIKDISLWVSEIDERVDDVEVEGELLYRREVLESLKEKENEVEI